MRQITFPILGFLVVMLSGFNLQAVEVTKNKVDNITNSSGITDNSSPENMIKPYIEGAHTKIEEGTVEVIYREESDGVVTLTKKYIRKDDGTPIETLLSQLQKDTDTNVREGAAEILGQRGGKEAVGPLINALQDSDDFVKEAAADALAKIGDKKAVIPLEEAVESADDEDLKASIAAALNILKGKEVKKQRTRLFN
ncbi:MAG: hypothetical protein C4560_09820 [Nitrospiraceae bacterium]|nr:MAG: hypothetical protein C4560_09820 [Nitrospiraceae bacterium]